MTTTFVHLLLQHAAQRPRAAALREKEYGIWQEWSWQRAAQTVRHMACGLAALGLKRGQHMAFVSDNRPYLYLGFLAAQAVGAVPVPLYQDAVADEMRFVIDETRIDLAFAENQEQVDKLLLVREQAPARLGRIIYEDPRGLRRYDHAALMSIADVIERGRQWEREHPGAWDAWLAAASAQDTTAVLYTSGTTGRPKGVVHAHASFIAAARGYVQVDGLRASDNAICYLPPAWAGNYLFSFAQWLVAGFTINCPEAASTVAQDMREIGPSHYFATPRVFEDMLTQLTIRMQDAAAPKRWLYRRAMALAQRVGVRLLDGKPVALRQRLLYALGNLCIYAPLRNALGLSRVRVAYTAGAAIGPDLFGFFRSIGVNLKQIYGHTETCGYVCMQRDGQVSVHDVGQACPGMEVQLSDNGEVLVRGPAVLKAYYERPDATAQVLDADGWFHTGDAGVLDAQGCLRIIDRAKDVGKTARGALFAPNYLENKLKFFAHIKEAVCFGHAREQVCAFINIDFEAVGNWAERQGLPYASYADLAAKAPVLHMIGECVEQANRDLAAESGMAETQIARFLVLHKELDADDDELTRTRKLRRGFIAEKYAVLVEALYSEKTEQFVETQVKFEDGRSGSISATLKILDAKVYPASAAA